MLYRKVLVGLCALLLAAGIGVTAETELWGVFESVDEMLEFRALPEYGESPALRQLVNQGLLPPVEERLPETPLVYKSALLFDGIGTYGDVFRLGTGMDPGGWATAAGQYAAWCGTMGYKQEGLLDLGPIWMLESPDPLPNLATDWEWSDDGKVLTMHLIEGVKWSDGVEFTADDILFTYNNNVLDPAVPSGQSEGTWTFGGEVTVLEKVDDYTIRWHFGTAYPVRALTLMDSYLNAPLPAHVFKPYHPAFNQEMTYDDYSRAAPPGALPQVVLGPFVPAIFRPGELILYVRNPFFWKVDEAGNQLPYFDVVIWEIGESWDARLYGLIDGTIDDAPVNVPAVLPLVMEAATEAESHLSVQLGDFTIPNNLLLNFSKHIGVTGERDLAVRELFRDLGFRKAVSFAIDREGLTRGVYGVPTVKPLYGPYPDACSYYREEEVVAYPYDLKEARGLLAELGFSDTDGDGILNWPDGSPIAGEPLLLELLSGGHTEHVAREEAIISMLRDVGIDLRIRTTTAWYEQMASMDWDMLITGPYTVVPWHRPEWLGVVDSATPAWHRAGPGDARDLLAFEGQIRSLLASAAIAVDSAEMEYIFVEIQRIYSENVYTVPLYQQSEPMAHAARIRNYPADLPNQFLEWYHNNVPVEILWTPEELQIPADRYITDYLDVIPTPERYEELEWYKP